MNVHNSFLINNLEIEEYRRDTIKDVETLKREKNIGNILKEEREKFNNLLTKTTKEEDPDNNDEKETEKDINLAQVIDIRKFFKK